MIHELYEVVLEVAVEAPWPAPFSRLQTEDSTLPMSLRYSHQSPKRADRKRLATSNSVSGPSATQY